MWDANEQAPGLKYSFMVVFLLLKVGPSMLWELPSFARMSCAATCAARTTFFTRATLSNAIGLASGLSFPWRRNMKKYLVLYMSSVPASEQMSKVSPEQAKAGMDLWMTWAKKVGSGIVDMGAPVGNGIKVARNGSSSPTDSKVSGFGILQAESTKALQELLKNHPHFRAPGASIEAFEFLPMPGMPQK